jgi:uncharacterized protein YyaL (SSP411 family)
MSPCESGPQFPQRRDATVTVVLCAEQPNVSGPAAPTRFLTMLLFSAPSAAMALAVLLPGVLLSPARLAAQVAANPAVESAEPANHLIHEKSPYLLQHAHNPVDWYPWGPAAFARARLENKPIFLSIGYSTCHWCHVMERESFENPAIAKLLNDGFVSIKVDREERPDVDATYMTFIQATTGGGGWPMTVFLTPELKPFAGGTYFPAQDSDGQPGLQTILPQVAATWREHAAEIRAQADQIVAQLQKITNPPPASGRKDTPNASLLDGAYDQLVAGFDAAHGGFGAAPKFPQPAMLNLLTRIYARRGPETPAGKKALAMDLSTLQHMSAGGIHDVLGGGFHRYSTDARWHVPHFEKMLYDQAQLAMACLDAYQITGDTEYAATARDILAYIQRDLTDPAGGGFLSAEDADSLPRAGSPQRVEGAFYVWTKTEIDAALGTADAPMFEYYYGVEPDGNVPPGSDARGELRGKNVLDATGRTVAATAAKFSGNADQVRTNLERDRAKLLAVRAQRPRPLRDDKIITAWNGLAISAFARAYQVLGDPMYLEAAGKAAAFLQANLYNPVSGKLTRSHRHGPSETGGFADDYAFLVQGLLDLYAADFDPGRLRWAEALQQTEDNLFWDEAGGGYFDTAGVDPNLLLRSKTDEDGAEPSANSVSALNLARLGQMLDNAADTKRARLVMQAAENTLRQAPLALPQMLVALDFQLGPIRQIVVAGVPGTPATAAMLRVARKPFLPRSVILLADGGAGQEFLSAHVNFFKDLKPLAGQATAYVCQDFTCHLPTSDVAVLATLLQGDTARTGSPAH